MVVVVVVMKIAERCCRGERCCKLVVMSQL